MFTIRWVLKALDVLHESTHFNVHKWAEQKLLQKQAIAANVSFFDYYIDFIVFGSNIQQDQWLNGRTDGGWTKEAPVCVARMQKRANHQEMPISPTSH